MIGDYTRMHDLRTALTYHNKLYYDRDTPEITDFEYDELMRELQDIESRWPEAVTPDSPTQSVGAKSSSNLGKAQHRTPMLSLSNIRSADDIRKWCARVESIVSNAD